jgi:acyl transferase domain-containing protein
MERPELSQPICTALQIALVNKFERHGVKPDGIVGHSSGEIAAAYTAGAISMDDAMKIAYYRGLVMKQKTQDGTMAAIGLGRQDVSKYLRDGVIVGCENSPTSTTLSGDREILLEVVSTIKQQLPDVLARLLKVDVAYHSRVSLDPTPQICFH